MSLRIIIFAGLWLMGLTAYSQHEQAAFEGDCDPELLCRDFKLILANTLDFLNADDGANAYRELKALEACDKCPEHRDNLDALSDEIIKLFREQNESLNSLVAEQQQTVADLQKLTKDLKQERHRVNQQLMINEDMTRDALVTNYLRLANKYYLQYDEIGRDEARWLTDFAYNYIDSSHHEVKKMMHHLVNDQVLTYLDYNPDDGYEEELIGEELSRGIAMAVDWSEDGKWLAVGLDIGRLLVFTAEGEIVYDQMASGLGIVDLHWDRESNVLAFTKDGYNVGFLKEFAGEWVETSRILNFDNAVSAVRWSPVNNSQLAVATYENLVYLFNEEERVPSITFNDGHADWIRDLAWSPNGEKLASCDDQGYIVTWLVEEGKILYRQQGHTDYVRTVDWHPDGHTIISGGDDNQLIFWDTAGQVFNRMTFDGWIYQARYSESGETIGLITGGNFFYNVTANDRKPTSISGNIGRFAWRGDKNTIEPADGLVLSTSTPASFIIPETLLENGKTRQGAQNENLSAGSITQVDWSPDGNFLAYVKDYSLEIVEEEKITTFDLQGTEIFSIAWHPGLSTQLPNSNFLATVSSDNQLLLWDVNTMSIIINEDLEVAARDLAWSPDGELLAIVNDYGELIVYDKTLTRKYEEKIANDFIRAIDWSPNGRYLLVGSDDNSVVVYDWIQRQAVERLTTHTDWVRDVLWLDDTHFASAADDSKTLIWGLSAREGKYKVLQTLDPLDGYHLSLAYIPGTSQSSLAIGTSADQMGIWIVNEAFTAHQDTLLNMEGQVHDMDWHPRSGSLAISTYASVPQELTRYLELQAAYESTNKQVITKSFEEALMNKKGGLTSSFYLPKIEVIPGRYDQVTWSQEEHFLAFVQPADKNSAFNKLQVHNMETREFLYEFSLPDKDISFTTISPNEQYLAVAPQAGYFTVLPIDSPGEQQQFALEEVEIIDWTWSANSRYLAILDRNYDVFLYDVNNQSVKEFANTIESYDLGTIMFNPNNDQLLYLLNHKGVYELQHNRDTEAQQIYEAITSSIYDTGSGAARGTWINGGKNLLYIQKGTTPQLLNIKRGAASLQHTMGDPENYYAWTGAPAEIMFEIHLLELDKYNFNGKDREYARAWSIKDGKPLSTLRGVRKQVVEEMELSPDGRYLATLGDALYPSEGKYQRGQSTISIWDVQSQKEVFELSLQGIEKVKFSPQGNYVYTYFENGQVGIWPFSTPRINTYLANSDKDRYLEQLSSKDNQPFRNRIEEWELEKGINFQEDTNFELLKEREIARIRQNWGEYFVDQAWLNKDDKIALASFNKARSLHYRRDQQRVRSNRTDTLALVNIWIEQTYFELGQNDERSAEVALRKAERLQPTLKRLKMLRLLLDWQEGKQEKLVQALANGEGLALLEEYTNWDRRDVHLKNEMLFRRLTAVIQSQPDPISPVEEPTFASLLGDLSPETREFLLLQYYRNNTRHPGLATDGERQTYYDTAVLFLDNRWEKTKLEEKSLQDYITYNFYLQELALKKSKLKKAAASTNRGRKAAEQLLMLDGDNQGSQEVYLNALAEEGAVELRLDPANARSVKDRLTVAKSKYPVTESPYLTLELANAKLLLGEKEAAYEHYYYLLEEYGYEGVEKLIVEEVSTLDRSERASLEQALQHYLDYRQDKENSRGSGVTVTSESLEGEAEHLVEYYWSVYQNAKEWYESSMALEATGMLPKDSLLQHSLEFNRTAGDYAFVLLSTSHWGDAQKTVDDMKQYLSQYQWPIAVEAILLVLKDDWPAARAHLSKVAAAPNDGIRTEEYPTLRAFLLNPPEAVKEHPGFQKRLEQWNNKLEE